VKPRTLKILAVALFAFIAMAIASGLYCSSVAMKKAQEISCANNMIAVCFSGRLWSNDHADRMPTNFICMSNEVVTPKVLHCPADRERPQVGVWEEFSEEKCSYVMVSPGVPPGTTNSVFIRCRIHGHLGFPDGSVRDANRSRVFRKF
jgi:hypothetical protein